MEADFRLQDARIAIIGLGLMGGSLALALKGKCARLYGVDSDPATRELAMARGIVDQATHEPTELWADADLVVLAVPVPAILQVLQDLPALSRSACIVLDLGSTKQTIVRAMASLPERFDPIGGHPICGKETLGLKYADANLYQDSAFIVTTLERTSPRAQSALQQIISAIGAHPIVMTAEDHDRILAATSHLPFLLSSALALSTPQEFRPYIGTGFKSASRLAGTPSHMMIGVLQTNRLQLLRALRAFRQTLNEMETALQKEEYSTLQPLLDQSRAVYESLISNP